MDLVSVHLAGLLKARSESSRSTRAGRVLRSWVVEQRARSVVRLPGRRAFVLTASIQLCGPT